MENYNLAQCVAAFNKICIQITKDLNSDVKQELEIKLALLAKKSILQI